MNVTKLVEEYVDDHPCIKDCLKKKLINYSALSRQISQEIEIPKTNFDAVLIACRRCLEKLKKYTLIEARIIELLKKSKVELKNKIMVVVLEKGIYFDNLIELQKKIKKKGEEIQMIQGANATTLVTSQEFLEDVKNLFKYKILKTTMDLVEIIIKSPREIEVIPGVVSYLYSLFGEHGINISETMSCWTDTIFVIEEKDIATAMKLLKF